jgi:hypothetical protein
MTSVRILRKPGFIGASKKRVKEICTKRRRHFFSQFRGSNIMFQDGNGVRKAVDGHGPLAHYVFYKAMNLYILMVA